MPSKAANLNRPAKSDNLAKKYSTFVVRPSPTPASHKTFLRVFFTRPALANLDLQNGALCWLTAAATGDDAANDNNGNNNSKSFPAVAWLASDPRLQPHVALISDSMRHLLGIGYEHKVVVTKYTDGVVDASSVVVKAVDAMEGEEPGSSKMSQREAEGWRWFLEHIFVETKYVTEGLIFNSLEFKGIKQSFWIESISSDESHDRERSLRAYKMTETSVVTISGSPDFGASEEKPSPARKSVSPEKSQPNKTSFASIGGLESQVSKLKTDLLSTLHQSYYFSRVNLKPPRGILLYGPPGTGKTLMLRAIASEIKASTFEINGSVVGKYMGESEAAVRKIFADARKSQPAIIFIDEVDSLAPKRTTGEGSEGRVVTTLLTEMDGMGVADDDGPTKIVVVAATNRPNSIDEALRRPGRFDREIEIGIPDVEARLKILRLLMKDIPFKETSDGGNSREAFTQALAGRTHGFVGADLESLVRMGFTTALRRTGIQGDNALLPSGDDTTSDHDNHDMISLQESDFEVALKEVRPTAMREVFIEPPSVRWSDIGGQEEVKQRLREAVEWPLTHPEVFARLGGTPRKGLLLYGPPGCSKTLTAKALATEAGLNFMAVKGPELFSMYVGESERAVREVFRKARAASPSIIFFDEIDALSASREGHKGGGVNVLTALLNEMDGIEALKNVVILAATNRPEIIDPALMRPGRLDTILYVGPPDLDARRQILSIKMRKMSVADDVDINALAEKTDGYSGAEIVNICDEAIHFAMRESFDIDAVASRHFAMALQKAVPQITSDMTRKYEQWSVGGVKKI